MGELSSGQTHLLTFFSRFFWAKYKIEESEKADYGINGDTIVIFIDEGEVALHPEWQRRYFSRVTSYLSELFHDRNIQLLITTHSPFVLSDIPKENVLFLERDGEGYCKVSPLVHEETFGGNIYNLLSDSFFMDNTLGKFAEDKIRWAMKSLSPDTEIIQETKEEIRYIIDRIGEPIMKEQLEHMFKVKFEGDEMEILRARIRELENFNSNSNDSSEDR
jgi:predicted ATP-binding protein involved in virulence